MKQWNKIFKWHGKVFERLQGDMPKIAKLFKKKGIKRVLDLGCGSGRHTVYLVKNGFEVYGIDVAPIGIKMAKDWLGKEKLKANFKIGNIYKKLPYKDNFFDAVVSTQTIHHERIENIRKAIKEVERILRSGGLIFMSVRKRKLGKAWKKGAIIEKYGFQRSRYKVIGLRTYIPIERGEKGLTHYLFNKELIRKEFKNFRPTIWIDPDGRHYCFSGELKK